MRKKWSPYQKKETKGNTADVKTVPDSGAAQVADSVEITAGIDVSRPAERGLDKFNTPTAEKDLSKSVAPQNKSKKERATNSDDQPLANAELKQANRSEQYEISRATPLTALKNDTIRKMETEVIKVQGETFADAEKVTGRVNGKEPKLQSTISGIVTDNKNNPLPNVYLRVDNKESYTTDPLGNFKIPATDSVINVSVSLQGYATQNFQLRSTHDGTGSIADNQIRLQSNDEMMARQQAMNYSKMKGKLDEQKGLMKITDQDAQPLYGWLTYEQYLEKK